MQAGHHEWLGDTLASDSNATDSEASVAGLDDGCFWMVEQHIFWCHNASCLARCVG